MPEKAKEVKFTVKDSVFTNLFKDRKYLLQLYQALHPEDKTATEDSLSNITINNVFINGQYNDLGFTVNGKLMILTEAQSTWSANILVRSLFYFAQSLQEFLDRENADLYGRKKVQLPESEIYVVYTGDRAKHPKELSLINEFFQDRKSAINVTVKMLYGTVNPDTTDGEDILGQYVLFTKIYDEQYHKYGRTKEAVAETIRICKDQNILKEYLASREKEVVTMMMSLYDQDRILEIHIESEKKIAAEKATKKAERAAKKAAKEANKKTTAEMLVANVDSLMRKKNFSIEDACDALDHTVEDYLSAKKLLADAAAVV